MKAPSQASRVLKRRGKVLLLKPVMSPRNLSQHGNEGEEVSKKEGEKGESAGIKVEYPSSPPLTVCVPSRRKPPSPHPHKQCWNLRSAAQSLTQSALGKCSDGEEV